MGRPASGSRPEHSTSSAATWSTARRPLHRDPEGRPPGPGRGAGRACGCGRIVSHGGAGGLKGYGISIGVSPREPLKRFAEVIAEAESLGCEAAWVVDFQLGLKD